MSTHLPKDFFTFDWMDKMVAFCEGADAFYLVEEHQNPYRWTSVLHEEWMKGWEAAELHENDELHLELEESL